MKNLEKLLDKDINKDVALRYGERIREGGISKQENEESHFCVYFAAYDSRAKKVFIGHHKKSGLWLFNGGHIDEGEAMEETLAREINEEWGLEASDFEIKEPELLTITEINNPTKQKCRWHYDIWYFIDVDADKFQPKQKNLDTEFYKTKWLEESEAKELVTDKNTLKGIDYLVENYF